MNGKIKPVVTPVDLIDEAGLSTTAPAQSKEFKLDNTAPDITVKIFKFDGAKSGNAILTKKNAEAKLEVGRITDSIWILMIAMMPMKLRKKYGNGMKLLMLI